MDLSFIRRDKSAIEAELRSAGAVFKGLACKCPFHDDAHASAGIYLGEDGAWRFKCQSAGCGFGGDVFDVRAKRTGKNIDDVLKDHADESNHGRPHKTTPEANGTKNAAFPSLGSLIAACGKIDASYAYTEPSSRKVEMVVVRKSDSDGKTFRQARPCGGGFEFGAPPKPWPIYNRGRLADAEFVIVVEGEKCVHALHEVGIVATTSPGGAANAANADWSPLSGKTVYLWPDMDEAGEKYMADVAAALEHVNPPARVLMIPVAEFGLEPKSDVVEFLAAFPQGKQGILNVLGLAEPMGASREVRAMIEESIAGKRSAIQWPWPALSAMTKSIRPGSVTILCGDPGASKSLMVLEAAAFWFKQDIPIALYELEETRGYHLARALAQRTNMSELTDPDWPKHHAQESRDLYTQNAGFLDSFGRVIHAAPDKAIGISALAAWIEAQAIAGKRIIIVDPITAVGYETKQSWNEDLAFIVGAKLAVAKHGASLILVTHPKQRSASATPTMHDISGGAAISRFSQCILCLKASRDRNVQVTNHTMQQPTSATVNRRVLIWKARDGRGTGAEIGFRFFSESLRFEEQGKIEKSVKQEHDEVSA